MFSGGKGRGRGRILTTELTDVSSTIGSQNDPRSETASSFTENTEATADLPEFSSIVTQSDQSHGAEKTHRGNPPKVMPGAPRGIGVQNMTSEFAWTCRRTSSGRSSARSIAHTNVSDIQSKSCEKQGTSGDPVIIIANYIKILTKPQWELFQYHVDFTPGVENKRFRREMIVQHHTTLKDTAFDGTTLYTLDDFGDLQTFTSRHPSTSEHVQVSLRKVARNSSDSPTFFHMANLIVRKLLEISGMRLIGKNYYQYDRKIDLNRYQLTLFPGFMTSVNSYQAGLMVNVDMSHKLINKTTVYQRLQDIFNQYEDVKQAQDIAVKELVGQIVLTTYNSKTYKIDEIGWERSPMQTFRMHDGSECSFLKYYEDRYQIKIMDTGQPLLVSKPSKKNRRAGASLPFLLIPELCCVTGITDIMRSDFKFMKDMSHCTNLDVDLRYKRLQEFVTDIHQNKECQTELAKWNIELDSDLLKFEARILDSEYIFYSDQAIKYNCNDPDWSRDSRGLRHIDPKALNEWIIVFPTSDEQVTLGLIDTLLHTFKVFGMDAQYPYIKQLNNDRTESYLKALEQSVSNKTNLVLCILSNSRKDRYDALKKYLCLDNPVPSQMVISKTISRRNQIMSIASKIAIQINAKLGGEIWRVHIPTKTLMVIGIDSYHDTKRRCPSIGAFVASTNPTLTQFYSRVIYQRTTQELLDGLAVCMRDALNEYHRNNRCLPEKIVLYRDGISNGQISAVAEHELPQMVQVFSKIMPGYEPKFAVIIVKKHGNARFFQQDGRQIINPLSGTIIDHTVTHADWYDFYLISQCAYQGVIAPTHYNVIWDRTNFKVDHMQRLTYKLCHLYYNWPGVIRVPAVCQYAHKLAFLVGQSLHQDFSDKLANKLFYL